MVGLTRPAEAGPTGAPDGGDGDDPRGDGHQQEVGGQDQVDVTLAPKTALALVQEPPVGKDGKVRADGWRVVAKNKARAAILINQGVHYWALEPFTHRDSSAVCVKLYDKKNDKTRSVYIASVYLDILSDALKTL